MEKFVVQWKCNRWVNCTDKSGKTLYFGSAVDAFNYIRPFLLGPHRNTYRIAEYLGGRSYREVEIIAE